MRMSLTKIKAFIAIVALTCCAILPLFAIRIPEVFYFPVTPNYALSLVSEKGNSLSAVLARIELPEADDIEIYFAYWTIRLKLNGQSFNYTLRLRIEMNGDIYLTALSDESYYRSFDHEPLIFPLSITYQTPIAIGENMSLKYLKNIGSLSVNNKQWNNVISAELKLGDTICTLYFAKGVGLIGIKTDSETFKIK